MNNSTSNALPTAGDELPRTLTLIILPFLSFGTVFGNILVLVAIVNHSDLRRVTYMPIFSLAIADLFAGVVAMPSYIMKKFTWSASIDNIVCDVFRFSYFLTGYASILSLTVISVERLIAIKNPLRYVTGVTYRRVGMALVFIWLDALVISSLPFVPWTPVKPYMECHYNPTRWWSIMVIVANVIVPFLLIAACYALMYMTAKTHIKKIASDRHGGKESFEEKCKDKTERRANITIMIVIGVFVASWFPSCFYYFLRKTCPACFSTFIQSSSFTNPLIYCWRSRYFRSSFRKILMRKWWQLSNLPSKAGSFNKNVHPPRRSTMESDDRGEFANESLPSGEAGKYTLKSDVWV